MNPYLAKTYSFDLPEELIASEPLKTRDTSRLLVIRKKSRTIEHASIQDLPQILDSNYSVVVNNTLVMKARLLGQRAETGGRVEFFLLKKKGECLWSGLMKTSFKAKEGIKLVFPKPGGGEVQAEVVGREDLPEGAMMTARFSEDPVEAGLGVVPLPPYIMAKRKEKDLSPTELEDYNTVFASKTGSVAAPTAGRHFTPDLIQKLKAKGIHWNEITLHVGMGTFKPVQTEDIREHTMHAETTDIPETVAESLNRDKRDGRKILSIGTTTTRTLEGRAKQTAHGFELAPGVEDVNLFIHPGSDFEFKFVDAVLTNFHLPESTLFMMIATFLGDTDFLQAIYQEAIAQKYRFYSYGDAMLILDT